MASGWHTVHTTLFQSNGRGRQFFDLEFPRLLGLLHFIYTSLRGIIDNMNLLVNGKSI